MVSTVQSREEDVNSEEQIVSDTDSLNKYEIKKQIGSGEFCDVFRAVVRENGHLVALKRLKIRQMLDGKSRFDCLREIRLLRKLDHPNIIRHIESFFWQNELFIVLEFADAGDLSKMLEYFRKKQISLTEKKLWKFMTQICAGLSYMHSKRIMHRDLKPANVLINRDGTVKLGDLGLSAILSATTENARSLVGTPYYMAPERLSELEYNFKADIWSLGCLLYELVTLFPPFYEPNQNLPMLMHKIRTLNYKPILGDYCPEVSYIVASCLVLEPQGRMDLADICQIAQRKNAIYQGESDHPTDDAHTFVAPANPVVEHMDVDMHHEPPRHHSHSLRASDLRTRAESTHSLGIDFTASQQTVTSASSSSQQPRMFKQFYRNLKNIF